VNTTPLNLEISDISSSHHVIEIFQSPTIKEARGAFSFVHAHATADHIHQVPWLDLTDPLKPKIESKDIATWNSLKLLMDLPYCQRMVTLQEIVLPLNGNVMYGPVVADLKAFLKVVSKIAPSQQHHSCCKIIIARLVPEHTEVIVDATKVLWMIYGTIHEFKRESNRQFLSLLYLNRFRLAHDPRDKIYGLVGLVSDSHYVIGVDYSLDAISVYLQFATTHIEYCGDLGILMFAGKKGRNSDLPCWVPVRAPLQFGQLTTHDTI
jgi:hypothetical protein